MENKIKINSIEIQINDKIITLSVEEAARLHEVLEELLGKTTIINPLYEKRQYPPYDTATPYPSLPQTWISESPTGPEGTRIECKGQVRSVND